MHSQFPFDSSEYKLKQCVNCNGIKTNSFIMQYSSEKIDWCMVAVLSTRWLVPQFTNHELLNWAIYAAKLKGGPFRRATRSRCAFARVPTTWKVYRIDAEKSFRWLINHNINYYHRYAVVFVGITLYASQIVWNKFHINFIYLLRHDLNRI